MVFLHFSLLRDDIKDPEKNPHIAGGSGFGRYCFYGCHCLPDEEHARESPPIGIPIDNIDRTCKQMGSCYQCLKVPVKANNIKNKSKFIQKID